MEVQAAVEVPEVVQAGRELVTSMMVATAGMADTSIAWYPRHARRMA
jgi:formate/nitrite transporter FocA (FNT family)